MTNSNAITQGLHHAGFTVPDIDATGAFLLEALGFEVGKITYVDDIGKDEVLAISYKGQDIKPGTLLSKTSRVDLVLGNGNRSSQTP